jgi:DNA polymerase III delta prime subunit
MKEHIEWVEKYRPQTVAECILPKHLKEKFQGFVDQGTAKTMMMFGGSGMGKTTVARAMCSELGIDPYFVNASFSGNIDTLRTKIADFASTGSVLGNKRKVVILDEGDYLNAQHTQPALRGFIEHFSKNCAFVLTCNYPNRIMKELRSRFSPQVEFSIPLEEKPEMAKQFFARACEILDLEKVPYEAGVVAQVVAHYFPDYRRVLNELQGYAISGKIDTGILSQLGNANLDQLYDIMQKKDFFGLREWSMQNSDFDSTTIFTDLYKVGVDRLAPECLPWLVNELNEGQVRDAVVADRELNLMATLDLIMSGVKFR